MKVSARTKLVCCVSPTCGTAIFGKRIKLSKVMSYIEGFLIEIALLLLIKDLHRTIDGGGATPISFLVEFTLEYFVASTTFDTIDHEILLYRLSR